MDVKFNKKKFYSNDEEKRDYRQELIDKIVEKMKDAVKYEKPWMTCDALPYNLESGTIYRGGNFLALLMEERNDPRWVTFKQIQEKAKADGAEYHVRKGEKGIQIQKVVPAYEKDASGNIAKDSKGNPKPVLDDNGKPKIGFKYYTVFNAEQIEGLPPLMKVEREFENYQPAEALIQAMKETGLTFEHHGQGRAYYAPATDTVKLPHKELFKNEGLYYRTAFHELGHATGHESRLNRDQTGSMHSSNQETLGKYALEELVAELSAYVVGAEIGVSYSPEAHENHAAYLNSWINALENKETGQKFFADATRMASKSADFQLERLHELTKEQIKEVEKEVSKDVEQVKTLAKAPEPAMAVKTPEKGVSLAM
jgi:antirestriction protein ArdC